MMPPQTGLALLYLAIGMLYVALAIPLIRGIVPRNGWYGFRVPKTLASDDVWFPANRFVGRDLLMCGKILVGGAALMLLFGNKLTKDHVAMFGLLVTLVPLAVTVYRGFRFLRGL
jgi:uncharacterized membrane protein